ncbi:uncharacterized protein [Polyergus mexicanus]|uniref:uncharacterized protein n=1 Tax=Polyergus mexicanus TaxID=615972 RepID=UPI0038B5FCED
MILSDVAKFFDLLGWAAPVIIVAKVYVQDLWTAGLDWDQPLPDRLRQRWVRVGPTDFRRPPYSTMDRVNQGGPHPITWVLGCLESSLCCKRLFTVEHTTRGSGRAVDRGSNLGGANQTSLDPETGALRCSQPFVANRVAKIQELVTPDRWRFVPTAENPADAATRGLKPLELAETPLWWKGPCWLRSPAAGWPREEDAYHTELMEERSVTLTSVTREVKINEVLHRFSSFTRLIRVTSFCLRFLRRLRQEDVDPAGCLSVAELERCRLRWLRIAQQQDFSEEL